MPNGTELTMAAEMFDRRYTSSAARGAVKVLRRPRSGWARTTRTALGMSARQVGDRLGVTASAVSQMERAEIDGAVTLAKLRQVAEVLGCDLVYGFVPRTSLDDAVQDQARKRALAELQATNHHMALEDQAVDIAELERLVVRLAPKYLGRRLWDGPAMGGSTG